ncbi:MAG: nuclear transport factor 2 family protein [Actinomycetota bacterium]
MSQENVELAREVFRRFRAGDQTWTEWVDPEVGWDFSAYPLADLPSSGRGREELLSDVLATYFSGWLDYAGEIVEAVDAGDVVVVIIHEAARMRDSDTMLERDVAHIWTFREGKWVFWRILPDREAALEAAGLKE